MWARHLKQIQFSNPILKEILGNFSWDIKILWDGRWVNSKCICSSISCNVTAGSILKRMDTNCRFVFKVRIQYDDKCKVYIYWMKLTICGWTNVGVLQVLKERVIIVIKRHYSKCKVHKLTTAITLWLFDFFDFVCIDQCISEISILHCWNNSCLMCSDVPNKSSWTASESLFEHFLERLLVSKRIPASWREIHKVKSGEFPQNI